MSSEKPSVDNLGEGGQSGKKIHLFKIDGEQGKKYEKGRLLFKHLSSKGITAVVLC